MQISKNSTHTFGCKFSQHFGQWFLFGGQFSPFCEKYFEREIYCCKFPVYLKKNCQKRFIIKNFPKNHHGFLEYEMMLFYFYFL
jgi:hypothetical protein